MQKPGKTIAKGMRLTSASLLKIKQSRRLTQAMNNSGNDHSEDGKMTMRRQICIVYFKSRGGFWGTPLFY